MKPADHVFPFATAKGAVMFIGIVKDHLLWRHEARDGRLTHVWRWTTDARSGKAE